MNENSGNAIANYDALHSPKVTFTKLTVTQCYEFMTLALTIIAIQQVVGIITAVAAKNTHLHTQQNCTMTHSKIIVYKIIIAYI